MAGYVSYKHQAAKEDLIISLRVHIRTLGGLPEVSEKLKVLKMDPHDVAAIMRLDRVVSLSKLQDMGDVLGLRLVMKWEPKNGLK